MKNIAVIGAGYWGKNLVRNYHQLGVLKSVCDSNSSILNSMKETYQNIAVQTDYNEILSDREIKGIVKGLPTEFHYSYPKG